jgi:uncharacterized repeat protein (TIGR01451 family)
MVMFPVVFGVKLEYTQRMASKRLNRVLARMACVLLLAALGYLALMPLSTSANSPGYSKPTYLVVITYEGWDDLQRLAPLELALLDGQVNVLAALVTAQELASVRSLGFDVRILDFPATPGQYYLVTLPPSGEVVPLSRYGQAFPYVTGTFILKTDPAEAELLPSQGFFIQKLLGPIVPPSAPPSAAADARPVLIQEHNPLIHSLVNSVSQTQIYTTILNLQDDDSIPGWDAERSRYSYSPELVIERDYIRGRMEVLGLDVRYHSFSLGTETLDNIEGTLSGWEAGSGTVYIACAHYDSISEDWDNAAPGADDNASGTAAVLEAARILSQYRFKHTLRFVTFAAEEQGLIGSYYYAAEARSAGTNIGGVINHDMIAWDSDGDGVMEIHAGTRSDSQALSSAFLDAMDAYSISLTPRYVTWGATTRSDHARFWNQAYPAMLAIEDLRDYNPYYHTTGDTLDKLDLLFARKFVQTTVATLAELAEIIPPGVRVEQSGPGGVVTGTLAKLTITYSDPGPDAASGVVMTETLSPGLTYVEDSSGFSMTQPASGTIVWQVGDLMPHTRSSFVVSVWVASDLPAGAVVSSTLDIRGVTTWDDSGDNRATWIGAVTYPRLYLPLVLKNID